ncbi:type VII secretion-associated protein [Mycolicibacter minnesotensis]|uniref:Type VII secretion-associated protein n=1 Tax=Mycolicibacter minnesotensis TaxID=1118379 RepID=A0A7I7R2M3_9MYCO|nr:type VII secretion-associated protein [Mycolicibacter minnesotensis]ORA99735.1 type VII secretion-associated protein [Mycolicibacter minnesotensis]BBY32909.1 type VII secretion-associated protein [Mycolicibacter minnesotensis]
MNLRHRAVIEAGPATIYRTCCVSAESARAAAALEWIDDPVGLLDEQPVSVPLLLRDVLACPLPVESVELIHPSWWPARRVQLLAAAAGGPDREVLTRSRAAVLAAASPAAVVVEIATGLVAVTTSASADVVAEPRIGAPDEVADAVAGRIRAALRCQPGAVVIDAPAGIGGAGVLSALIEERLRPAVPTTTVDQLPKTRRTVDAPVAEPADPDHRRPLAPAGVVGGVLVLALALLTRHSARPDAGAAVTYLVENHVAVQVPAEWTTRRVTGGPGSARVEVVSPNDPRLMLLVTQAPAAADTLTAIAEPLQRALERADDEMPGVFVDFDPAGISAGRPAVTYREVRDGRRVDWTVVVDRGLRIAVGCQSEPGGEAALRAACEAAVRSAHAIR